MKKEKEFQEQVVKDDLRNLDELKKYQDLCDFYREHFDEISSFIARNGTKSAIEDMVNKGMPIKEEIPYFNEFINQINSAIDRGNIKKVDL